MLRVHAFLLKPQPELFKVPSLQSQSYNLIEASKLLVHEYEGQQKQHVNQRISQLSLYGIPPMKRTGNSFASGCRLSILT